jgi:hypothetical protein
MLKRWRWPLGSSVFVLLSQAFRLPSPVRDAASGAWPAGFSLHLPPLYWLFAPFCGPADRITLLSYHQAVVFLVYAVAAILVFLGLRKGALGVLLLIVFLSWTVLIPHPQARLVAVDPDILLIDFHSHTSFSHDGRKWPIAFTPERNMRWHQAQGYGAAFITDHNRIDAAEQAKAVTRADWRQTGYRSLEGEEVSLLKTHLVVLGAHERIDNQPWDSNPRKIRLFIAEMNKRRLPVIASIPEYWLYHWKPTITSMGTVDDFIAWGIQGFEIVNSAPIAGDFPPAYRRRIVELCRAHNLPMTGISDTHGWGYATAAWNAMRVPGWQQMDPDQLETVVLKTLKSEGVEAVEVLERARYNPEQFLSLLCSPFIDAGIYWRSLQLLEVLSWIFWIWLATAIHKLWLKK